MDTSLDINTKDINTKDINTNIPDYLIKNNIINQPKPFSIFTKTKYKKDNIKLNIKEEVWFKYFKYSLYGTCCYCKNYILIPNSLFKKLYPKSNINDFDNLIPTFIISTHFDHIKSEYNLGKTNKDNLHPICSLCNLKKNKKNNEDFILSKSFTDNSEYNTDFMDIDTINNKCKGVILDNKGFARNCCNSSYFRGKCSTHMYQNIY